MAPTGPIPDRPVPIHRVPIHHVDAFTRRPFAGNPAAVCLLERPAPVGWMAAVAAEVNLSETAFVHRDGARWALRWFTPETEVPLCGHATLAAAHVLRREGHVGRSDVIEFATASGRLVARTEDDRIALDFPAYEAADVEADLVPAIDAAVTAGVVAARRYGPKLLVAVADEAAVAAGVTSTAAVAALPAEGLVLTAATDAGYVLRFFAPAVGIPEDPVTGSAQCAAAPYWRDATGREAWQVRQLSARGGELRVRVTPGGRVVMAGHAVTVATGELLAGPD